MQWKFSANISSFINLLNIHVKNIINTWLLISVKELFFTVLPVFTGICEGVMQTPLLCPSHSKNHA